MTGPLHRLSSHLRGEGLPRVQAMVRLPFGPTPTLQADAPQNDTPLSNASPQQEWPGDAVQRPPPPVRAAAGKDHLDISPAFTVAPVQHPVEDSERSSFQSLLAPRPTQAVNTQTNAALFSAAPSQRPLPQGEKASIPDPLEPEHTVSEIASLRQSTLLAQTRPSTVQGWPSPLVPIKTGDTTLGPHHDGTDGVTGNAQPASARTMQHGRVAPTTALQPNEVHVHIGRIEVTALHEPPAAAPARIKRNSPQPMSLDDYLSKRRSKT